MAEVIDIQTHFICHIVDPPYRRNPLVKGIIVESGNSSRDFTDIVPVDQISEVEFLDLAGI